jgi:hypothetical protein
MNLGRTVNFVRSINSTAAGTTAVNGAHVDMSGYDGVLFLLCVGALTATQVTGMKAQGGNAANDSDMADLAGTANAFAFADGDSNRMLALEIYRPTGFRYIRPVVTRGTANAALDAVVAVQYQGLRLSAGQSADSGMGSVAFDASIRNVFVNASPAAGTP